MTQIKITTQHGSQNIVPKEPPRHQSDSGGGVFGFLKIFAPHSKKPDTTVSELHAASLEEQHESPQDEKKPIEGTNVVPIVATDDLDQTNLESDKIKSAEWQATPTADTVEATPKGLKNSVEFDEYDSITANSAQLTCQAANQPSAAVNETKSPVVHDCLNVPLLETKSHEPSELKTRDTVVDERSCAPSQGSDVMDWGSLADNTSLTISYRVPREAENVGIVESPVKSPAASSRNSVMSARAEAKRFIGRNRLGGVGGSPRSIPEKQPLPDEKYEDDVSLKNRIIRLRNPFPVLKPAPGPRDDETISVAHSIGNPEVHVRWMKPKPELKTLIVAAMGTSLQRRSNACGALKVLTAKKKNQMMLVRTDGFLNAILFTASQDIPKTESDLAIDARARAIACLQSVSGPKENRVNIIQHPGVVECLLKVVTEDNGGARASACATLALLAKSSECREGLVEYKEIVDAMSIVLRGEEEGENLSMVQAELTPEHEATDEKKDGTADTTRSQDSISDGSMTCSDSDFSDEEDDVDGCDGSLSDASRRSSKKAPKPAAALPVDLQHVDSIRYRQEERLGVYQQQAQLNACAFLVHLSRHCAVSVRIHKQARNDVFSYIPTYIRLCAARSCKERNSNRGLRKGRK
jgi:hypothetical protein